MAFTIAILGLSKYRLLYDWKDTLRHTIFIWAEPNIIMKVNQVKISNPKKRRRIPSFRTLNRSGTTLIERIFSSSTSTRTRAARATSTRAWRRQRPAAMSRSIWVSPGSVRACQPRSNSLICRTKAMTLMELTGPRKRIKDGLPQARVLSPHRTPRRSRSPLLLKWWTTRLEMKQRDLPSLSSSRGSLRTWAVKNGSAILLCSISCKRTNPSNRSLHSRLSRTWSTAWPRRLSSPWETHICSLRAPTIPRIAPPIMIAQRDNQCRSLSRAARPPCSKQPIARTDSVRW